MAKKKKAKKALKGGMADEHALDRLYAAMDSRKGADPGSSGLARLLKRGRSQIAKKLGEEAVETAIEGIRGDRVKLVSESVDMLYHLLALWVATEIKPAAVWAELALRADDDAPPAALEA